MIKTPSTTMIGGAVIWTPSCTVIGSQNNIHQFIKSLFAGGTQGLYLNAQDAASIADLSSIKDLSGNNNHALQSDSMRRAILVTDPSGYKSLKFDGVDDGYVTQSINFSGTDKVTVIAAVKKLSDAQIGSIVCLSNNPLSAVGAFELYTPGVVGTSSYTFLTRDTANNFLVSANYVAPYSAVITAKRAFTEGVANLKVNSSTYTNTATKITTNFSNQPIYIGRRGGTLIPFNGQIYALLVIGKLLDDATTQRIEKEFAKYIGVTL